MEFTFYKYQGTGNDFVMINGISQTLNMDLFSESKVRQLCDRRFGIGADGLIIMERSEKADFRMLYYNADGRQSSMCGNGGRCIVDFAIEQGVVFDQCSFEAVDGMHFGKRSEKLITISMQDVHDFEHFINGDYTINTGSPHYVSEVGDVDQIDLIAFAKEIRYSEAYAEDGINVNVVSSSGEGLSMRTYERGVEDETYSCGTGVTAAALVHSLKSNLKGEQSLQIATKGGLLQVNFIANTNQSFTNIMLSGPVVCVYKGITKLD